MSASGWAAASFGRQSANGRIRVTMGAKSMKGQAGGKAASMSARQMLIHILLFVAVMVAISAVAIWFNLGPVVR
jgi:hypothetical protein